MNDSLQKQNAFSNKKSQKPLLELRSVSVSFGAGEERIQITDRVSFTMEAGEIFALVGESGCGKSVTASAIVSLLPRPAGHVDGEILLQGENISQSKAERLQEIRARRIRMIFQDPGSALNPVLPLGVQLMEAWPNEDKKAGVKRLQQWLQEVGFGDPERIWYSYPHQLSGGMQQRIMIVMALAAEPDLLIADEPTTALDVTVQAQIMEILLRLSREHNIGILLITHNLNLVAQYAQRVGVMYAGRLIECGPAQAVVHNPGHPYTKGLLGALPSMDGSLDDLQAIKGHVPPPSEFIEGCRFADRCSQKKEECIEHPEWKDMPFPGHTVACFYGGSDEIA